MLVIAVAMAVGSVCGAATPQGTGTSSPTQAKSPLASPSTGRGPVTTPATDTLVKCEDFPQQTYTDSTFGFSISCPSSFSLELYSSPYSALFLARTVDDKYLVGDPPGQISIDVYAGDSGSLRDWIAAHTGAPNGGDPIHLWGSTSNLSDTQVAENRPSALTQRHRVPDLLPPATQLPLCCPTGTCSSSIGARTRVTMQRLSQRPPNR